jgi:acetoin utilization deacetylase AcuC-like enzyme
VNIPWNCGGMNDADYMYAFEKIVMPIAREYNPDIVLVSAGFDAAMGDELGECNVTANGFAEMTRQLLTLADGRMALALEGGYLF